MRVPEPIEKSSAALEKDPFYLAVFGSVSAFQALFHLLRPPANLQEGIQPTSQYNGNDDHDNP